jgi:putative DNA primase/helicase
VKRVAILPDNDAAGQTGAESTARCCHAAGLQVQIVELLGLPPKGDIIDWLDAGGTRDELLKLTKAAPLFSPAAHETAERPSAKWEVTPRRTFQQPPQQGRSVDVLFEDLELWPDAVHLAQLLDEIHGVVTRYVILPDGAADAVTLWIAFTYLMDVWHVAPNLMATSPTKQCGKTRLLQVVRGLVYRALTCSSVTGPALFRVIEKYGPTLLIDEAENALTDKHNDVYALLNAGHTRDTAIAIRTVGEKQHEPAVFSTWAPKMFTLIGRLRDTVMDRSINIEMRRRAAGEVVAPMRAAAFAEVCCPLRRKLLRWSEDARERAAAIEPTFPEGLRDRAQDNWSALLVIAQLAGPAWVERAHAAAVLLSGGEEANDDSLGVQLLADCRAIHAREGGDAIASKRLVELLTDIEDRPYADARGGKGISQAWLAGQLKRWKIVSAGTVRFGATTAKGYRWASFRDAWSRYLPSPQNECDGSSVVGDAPCDGSGPQNRPINTEGCYGVTAVTALRGEEEEAAADGLF